MLERNKGLAQARGCTSGRTRVFSRPDPRWVRRTEYRGQAVARSMWRGAIQFGLVTIPVRLYLATESKGISFNMLHAKDLSRIQMKTYCPVEDDVISRGDTVKGFEYAPGQYVVVTDEDLASVPLKTVRAIEIELFTAANPDNAAVRFVKGAYYLEPEAIGRKAFYLLREVLADKQLTAICKVVIKDREVLGAIDPFSSTMLLTTLHWPDEIRSVAELDLPDELPEAKPAEKAMAEQLIGAMTAEFDPSTYHDDYREALLKLIEDKVAGQETVEPVAPQPATNIVDLMAALEASVKAAVEARGTSVPTSVEAHARTSAKAKAKANETAQVEADAEAAPPARRRKSA